MTRPGYAPLILTSDPADAEERPWDEDSYHQPDCGCYHCTVKRDPNHYRQPRNWRGLLRWASKRLLLASYYKR